MSTGVGILTRFLREMKTPGLPDVTQLMMVELVYRDNKVFIRTKPRMDTDSKVPWSNERRFYSDPNQHHPRPRNDQQPPRASYRKVKDWKDVIRDLTNWCNGGGTVRPSQRDKHEMLSDLQTWGTRPHRTLNSEPPPFPSFVNMTPIGPPPPQVPPPPGSPP